MTVDVAAMDRFLDKKVYGPIPENPYIPLDTVCWLWVSSLSHNGYGVFHYQGRTVRAPRFVFEQFVHAIPRGKHIDHLCNIRACVNPDHLDAVTQAENNNREDEMITHCPKGHEYAGENLYVDPKGVRRCRQCRRQGMRKGRKTRLWATKSY